MDDVLNLPSAMAINIVLTVANVALRVGNVTSTVRSRLSKTGFTRVMNNNLLNNNNTTLFNSTVTA